MRTLLDYTANDVTPDQRLQYAAHVDLWQLELQPNGALECYFAAEIVRAAWRIERYSPLAATDLNASPDPKILRYRDQTNLGLRRNLEELRRLQSDRYLQAHLGLLLPGVASLKSVLPCLKLPKQQAQPEAADPQSAEPSAAETEAKLHARLEDEERREMTEYYKDNPEEAPQQAASPTPVPIRPAAGRNELCPCNSGQKFKRCCGHWSKMPAPRNEDEAA